MKSVLFIVYLVTVLLSLAVFIIQVLGDCIRIG